MFILPVCSVVFICKLFLLKFELFNIRIFIAFYNRLDVGSMDDLGEFTQSPAILQRIIYLRYAKNVSDDPAFEYDSDNKMVKCSRYKKHNHLYILVCSLTFVSL